MPRTRTEDLAPLTGERFHVSEDSENEYFLMDLPPAQFNQLFPTDQQDPCTSTVLTFEAAPMEKTYFIKRKGASKEFSVTIQKGEVMNTFERVGKILNILRPEEIQIEYPLKIAGGGEKAITVSFNKFPLVKRYPATLGIDEQELNSGVYIHDGKLHGLKEPMTPEKISEVGLGIKTAVLVGQDRQSDLLSFLTCGEEVQEILKQLT